jgi:hypothetical protein
MKNPKKPCKCLNCNELFVANYRSKERQRFCSQAGCQKARKRASQKAWLAKPGNQNYFRDAENAERVRQWQKAHPDYWKDSARGRRRTLQDACPQQTLAKTELLPPCSARTLQDLCSMPIPLFIGLISMWTGSTLQDDIVTTARQVVAKGHDILGMVPGMKLERSFDEKTCSLSGAAPQSSSSVQLDRSPAGPGKLLHPV